MYSLTIWIDGVCKHVEVSNTKSGTASLMASMLAEIEWRDSVRACDVISVLDLNAKGAA